MASLPFAPKISLFVLKLKMRKSSGGATKADIDDFLIFNLDLPLFIPRIRSYPKTEESFNIRY
jgi:hypothetical protein